MGDIRSMVRVLPRALVLSGVLAGGWLIASAATASAADTQPAARTGLLTSAGELVGGTVDAVTAPVTDVVRTTVPPRQAPAPSKPATTKPAAKPAAVKPSTTKPAATKPAATKSAAKPATTKPATTKPVATKSATTKRATTAPVPARATSAKATGQSSASSTPRRGLLGKVAKTAAETGSGSTLQVRRPVSELLSATTDLTASVSGLVNDSTLALTPVTDLVDRTLTAPLRLPLVTDIVTTAGSVPGDILTPVGVGLPAVLEPLLPVEVPVQLPVEPPFQTPVVTPGSALPPASAAPMTTEVSTSVDRVDRAVRSAETRTMTRSETGRSVRIAPATTSTGDLVPATSVPRYAASRARAEAPARDFEPGPAGPTSPGGPAGAPSPFGGQAGAGTTRDGGPSTFGTLDFVSLNIRLGTMPGTRDEAARLPAAPAYLPGFSPA